MRIKVCGMREASNILALSELAPDYLGLIFYPASNRYVAHIDSIILESLSPQVKLTGVFVNEEADIILKTARQYKLKALQLHGDETPDYCRTLRLSLKDHPDMELIKAFGINETFDFSILEDYVDEVDFFLFDTKTPARGGSGLKFDWRLLEKYQLNKPYFLSGGINLADLEELKELRYPGLYAADINSKFEIAPGLKDIGQVKQAIDLIRDPLAQL